MVKSQVQGEQREFAKRALQDASEWILARTVVLYAQATGGNPVIEGTGVLLKIADVAFILSAAHVCAGVVKDGRALLVGVHGAPLISLEGLDVQVSDDRGDEDIAFMRLPSEVAVVLARHKSFLRLSEVDVERRPPTRGSYAVLGFPCGSQRTVAEGVLNAEPFWFLSWLYEGELVSFTVGKSIALEFVPKRVLDLNGDPVRAPELRGISGCGIWRLIGIDDGVPGQAWQPAHTIRLAGIEHTVVGPAIKGVLAFRVVDAIRQNHADVASADVSR